MSFRLETEHLFLTWLYGLLTTYSCCKIFEDIFNFRAYSNYADQSSLHYNNYSNYGNYSNFPSYSYDTNNYNNVSYGYGTSDSLYNNGRFNAVAQKLSVISNLSEDLNESSIGTHV